MKITVRLEHDSDTENPLDWDGSWTLYSFGRRHGNFRNPEELGLSLEQDSDGWPVVQNPGLRRKMAVGLAFFVSYYEHSGVQWSLPGEGMQCRWDSVRCAGLLVWMNKPSDMGARTYEDRKKDARGCLEIYNSWLNGDCYYWMVEQDGDDLNSCGGYIGSDHLEGMFDEIRDAIPDDADEIEVVGDAKWLTDRYSVDKKDFEARGAKWIARVIGCPERKKIVRWLKSLDAHRIDLLAEVAADNGPFLDLVEELEAPREYGHRLTFRPSVLQEIPNAHA